MAKTAQKNIEVKPERGGWSVKRGGSAQASGKYSTKREATSAARKIAGEQHLDLIIYEPGRRFTEIRTADSETDKKISERVTRGKSEDQPSTQDSAENLSAQKRAQSWREWATGHKRNLPTLSDESISRESIYGERG